jgi:hypothetical protein
MRKEENKVKSRYESVNKTRDHPSPVKKIKKMYSSLPILDQVCKLEQAGKIMKKKNTNVSRPK